MLANIAFLFAFLSFTFAQDEVVTTMDPRMHFVGTWVDQDNGGHRFTGTIGDSVSLDFTGTSIAWHAAFNPNCGVGKVSVDGGPDVQVDASAGTAKSDGSLHAVLFSKDGLKAGQHSIKITFAAHGALGGPYLEVWNLTYSQSAAAAAPKPSSQDNPTFTTTSIEQKHGSETSTFVSITTAAPRMTTQYTQTQTNSTITSSTTEISSASNVTLSSTIPSTSNIGDGFTTTQYIQTGSSAAASAVSSTNTSSGVTDGASNGVPSSNASRRPNVGMIAGVIVGGILGVILLLGLIIYFRRKRHKEPYATPYTVNQLDPSRLVTRKTPRSSRAPSTLPSPPPQLSPPSPIETPRQLILIDIDEEIPHQSSTTRLVPLRNEPSRSSSVVEDPPPPYIPRRGNKPALPLNP